MHFSVGTGFYAKSIQEFNELDDFNYTSKNLHKIKPRPIAYGGNLGHRAMLYIYDP